MLASVFSQQASPRLWLAAQQMIGGTPDKQAILRRHYRGESRVVEVGCSIGNLARALIDQPDVAYLGLDVDAGALAFARRWFALYKAFRFSDQTLQDLARTGARFDLICVTGVLHHVEDAVAEAILQGASAVAAPGARLLMFDPVPLRAGDGLVYRLIHRIEQGEYLREPETLDRMIAAAGFRIVHREDVPIGPGLVSSPKIMTMHVAVATLEQ